MKLIKYIFLSILSVILIEQNSYSQSKLVINEILANPVSDANGDAAINADDDEFIELVNISGTSVDISGWTISDNASVRYTFPASTTIPSGKAVIIFGGGSPVGSFGGAIVLIASTLDLDDRGDMVVLKNSTGDIIDKYVYGLEGNNGVSLARVPDLTGTFILHNSLPAALPYSPGRSNTDDAYTFPLTTSITATMTDALVDDINSNSSVNPGEQIEYTVTISNTGSDVAADVNLNNTIDTHTSFVPGSIKTTPLALTDYYNTELNTVLNPNAGSGLLINDIDPDGGSVTVTGYGTSISPNTVTAGGAPTVTDANGTVTVNADGSFTYNPPSNQTGADKFGYTIKDADNNTQTADVELNIFGTSPAASSDSYTIVVSTELNVPDGAGDLLSNDDLGIPNGVIISFGGGSTGGSVTSNAAGTTYTGSGNSLKVNADGSFTLTPTSTGSFTFLYRVKNSEGFSDGTVTVAVQSVPVAVNDPNGGLSPTSAPGDPYHSAINTTLVVADGADDLLSNDDLGIPTAVIVSYGTTASPTTQTTIGNSTPTDNGGSVTINADGSFSYDPPTATFTGLDQFAYKIQNAAGSSTATVTVAVGIRPSAVDENYTTITGNTIVGNISINTVNSTNFSVLSNDAGDQLTVTGFSAASAHGGNVSVQSNGTFSYNPPVGYEGSDNFTYTMNNGFNNVQTGTVTLTVGEVVWFINASAGGGGDGRRGTPFNSITSFNSTASDEASDIIFVSGGTYNSSSIILLNNQKLIGEGAAGTFASSTGLTLPSDVDALPSVAGTPPAISNSGNTLITLGSGNTINGVSLGNSSTAISGSSFGTLAVSNSSINTNGTALSLSTGTFNGTFSSISSSGGTNNITLSTVDGTLTLGSGTLSGASGASFNVSGGKVTITYSGGITQSNNAAIVSISGGHNTGTITFNTGTLSATNGTGLQFDNADGTYNFNGTTTLNGGNAGIDILDNSGGTFTFNSSTNITHSGASDQAFFVSGSFPNVTYSGNITKTGGSWATDIFSQGSGTITFQTGTISASGSSTGITFNNADGTINYNGTTTLSGGTARINVQDGSSGAITFGTGASVSGSPSGVGALNISNGSSAINLDYNGTLTGNPGFIAFIEGVSSGTVNIDGNISSTGQGILIQNNTGGTISFTGSTKSLSTGTNAAVNLSSNTGATINFTGGGLAITTSSGTGFNATGGGTVNVTGSGNTITSPTGTAINVNATTIGSSNLNFQSISSSGSAAPTGIVLNNTGSSGGLHVTGNSSAGSGGTVANKTGSDGGTTTGCGVYLNSTSNVSLNYMQLNDFANFAILGTSVTGFTLANSTINGSNGDNYAISEGSISFDGLYGTSSFTIDDIEGGRQRNVRIVNASGTSDITINSCTIQKTAASTGGDDNLFIESNTSATITAHVTNNTFKDTYGDQFQSNCLNSSTMTVVFTGNFFSTADAGWASQVLGGGVTIGGGNAGSTEHMNFNISNNGSAGNPLTGDIGGGVLNINEGTGGGTWQGQVSGNYIGNPSVSNSASTSAPGIRVENHSVSGKLTAIVDGNHVSQWNSGPGINFQIGDTGNDNSTLDLTVTNNIITNPGASTQHGIVGNFGADASGANIVAIDIHTNTVNLGSSPPNGGANIRLRQRNSSTVKLVGYSGGNTNTTSVNSYIAGQNTLTPSGNVTSSVAVPPGGGFIDGTVATPTVPN